MLTLYFVIASGYGAYLYGRGATITEAISAGFLWPYHLLVGILL
jgi:hypothetical protein